MSLSISVYMSAVESLDVLRVLLNCPEEVFLRTGGRALVKLSRCSFGLSEAELSIPLVGGLMCCICINICICISIGSRVIAATGLLVFLAVGKGEGLL